MNVVRLDSWRRHPAGLLDSASTRQGYDAAPRRMSRRVARQWRATTVLCWTAACVALGARSGLVVPALASTVFAAAQWWSAARALSGELRIRQDAILWSGLVGDELRIVLRDEHGGSS